MIVFAYTACFLGGLAGTIYLVTRGHPWFAGLVLLATAALEFHNECGCECEKQPSKRKEVTPQGDGEI